MNPRLRMRLSMLAIAGCLSIGCGGVSHAQLKVTSHAGSVDGLLANSHLIAGRDEGLLIDAQLTRSDALQVVEMIKRSQIERLTVFITHGHPDHYLGLAEILSAFPRARAFSNAATAIAIARDGNKARDYWKRSLGDDIVDRVIIPEVLRTREIELEGDAIRVIEMRDSSESARPSVLYLRQRGWLFSGDLVYSGVHLWLAEDRPKKWRVALDELGALGQIDMIYPGHGEAGSAGLLERNRTYLTRFMELTRKTGDAEELIEGMEDLYPAHQLPFFLRRAAEIAKGTSSQ